MKRVLLGFAALCWSVPVMAQEVGDCDWRSSAAALYEPWEEYSRTFANGDVRIALLDTIEPGQAPVHLLVLSPPYDELGGRQCRVISHQGQRGFADVDFSTLEAAYDPAVGLIFSVSVKIIEGEVPQDWRLQFTLNQATGEIGADLR